MPVPMVTDLAIITEVAGMGGSTAVSKGGLWPTIAQRLGLKSARAGEVQRRYAEILDSMPRDSSDELLTDVDGESDAGADALGDASPERAARDEGIVERILAERMHKGRRMYRVKWEGADETTWEPAELVAHCRAELRAWQREQSANAAQPPRERPGASAAPARGRSGATEPFTALTANHARTRAAATAEPRARAARKRSASDGAGGGDDAAIVRCGLLDMDEVAHVVGPTSVALQWLVAWRSGCVSVVSNEQLKSAAPHALFKWYESTLVLDDVA
ncbi:hypothetical protein KFE25_004137 [Diacronema lutheri]|uniref:Chromo domain-containing protein n=1 Tax=Diacronema lutheri TaxID=2081491 RepID=A0A8J5X3L9_DIALT|nr:hypothetical protein KFE25_004137 [Diacronema lutheri]